MKVSLGQLAHGRSGDKGDMVNIALIAHKPEWMELLSEAVTPKMLEQWFEGWSEGPFEVFEVPGIGAINCLIHKVLQGGGTVSKRLDSQGKALGQVILEAEVEIDDQRAAELGFHL
ncbi:MAG: AtuA-related protein [Candidatus Poseidoniales archaeon]|tara:strand:- start:278 stop:625 length:348 start_codon:yes stop_codon:yes gene_type:complete